VNGKIKTVFFDQINLCINYNNMMTFRDIVQIIENITYKRGWSILVNVDGLEKRPYLQVEFNAEDAETGNVEKQRCRKWMLSYHMTTTEIVYTALKAIQAAEDHETREFFRYKNVRIVNPHFSVDDIVKMVNQKKLNEESRILIPSCGTDKN